VDYSKTYCIIHRHIIHATNSIITCTADVIFSLTIASKQPLLRSNTEAEGITNNDLIPWSVEGTDETTDIIFGSGDLEQDFAGCGDFRSFSGTELDCCLARDFDFDVERDLELQCDLNLDLTGDRDRERRIRSLECRLRSEERRRAECGE